MSLMFHDDDEHDNDDDGWEHVAFKKSLDQSGVAKIVSTLYFIYSRASQSSRRLKMQEKNTKTCRTK